MRAMAHPKSEFKRLSSGIDPIKTVIGLALIPVLYAAVYLYANWDPYRNLEQVDAALVNLDAGAEFDDEHRIIGDDVAEELIDDASFGWRTVKTRDEAAAGTYRGDVQFALIIPEDFSASLASPADFESAEQAQLQIITNEANNYLLTSIVEVLAAELHQSVSEQVGREAADQMLTGFGQIHQELMDAADGADELHTGNTDLAGGLTELREGAGTLSTGAQEIDDGVGQLGQNLITLRTGTGDLASGAAELHTGATDLHSGLVTIDTGVNGIQDGADTLAEGASDLSAGLGRLSTGADQVAEGNEQLSTASHQAAQTLLEVESAAETRLEDSVQSLIDAGIITEEQRQETAEALAPAADDSALVQQAQTARAELSQAQESIDQLAAGAREVADGAAELSSGSAELVAGSSEFSESLPGLSDGLGQARTGAWQLTDGAGELAEGAAVLDTGVARLQNGVGSLAEGTESVKDGSTDLHEGLGNAEDGASDLAEGAQELATALGAGAEDIPNPHDQQREQISEVIGNPLNITETSQAEAGSYGAGMAPFFMGLALWIGTLVMMQVLRPTSARVLLSNVSNFTAAIGSWIPFLLLGMVQSLILYAAVVFGVGLEPAHPVLTLMMLLAASTAFTALIQGVVTLLGNPGKFIIILLLVLQLVASGGTFPAQTLPGALEFLHPVLPLSYVTDGLRHVIYGADTSVIAGALAALGITTLLGLGILLLAVKKHRMWNLERLQPSIEEVA